MIDYFDCTNNLNDHNDIIHEYINLTIASDGIYKIDEDGDVIETGKVTVDELSITLCEKGETSCRPTQYNLHEDQGTTFMDIYSTFNH